MVDLPMGESENNLSKYGLFTLIPWGDFRETSSGRVKGGPKARPKNGHTLDPAAGTHTGLVVSSEVKSKLVRSEVKIQVGEVRSMKKQQLQD